MTVTNEWRRRWRGIAVIGLTASLVACGSTTRGPDYQTAGARKTPLDIPPDLVSPTASDRYAIPKPGDATTLSDFERARRQGEASNSTLAPKYVNVTLERDGQLRWLKLKDITPEETWQGVREFWQESGFVIANESAETGVIQTDWAERRAKVSSGFIRDTLSRALGTQYSTAERDAFKSRIEVVDGATEIYISHRGMVEVISSSLDGDTRWQPRPSDHNLEVEFLRRLMTHFGATEEQSVAALAKAKEPLPALADLVVVDEANVLRINEGFDRAWRRVGLALDRSGFTVEDRDRSKGTYFVRYIDADKRKEKPGLLARMFGGKEKEEEQRKYRIVVAEQGEKADVTVRAREEGDPRVQGTETAKRMLALIQEKLGR